MARKGKSTEEVIQALREAEVRLGQGETVGRICRDTARPHRGWEELSDADRDRRVYAAVSGDRRGAPTAI